MTKLATGTYEAYPPGSELWYADLDGVRQVRVAAVEVITRDDDLVPLMVRHRLEPVDTGDPLDASSAYASRLHGDKAVAERLVRAARRASRDAREAASGSDAVSVDVSALRGKGELSAVKTPPKRGWRVRAVQGRRSGKAPIADAGRTGRAKGAGL